jgi:hypothetical protein
MYFLHLTVRNQEHFYFAKPHPQDVLLFNLKMFFPSINTHNRITLCASAREWLGDCWPSTCHSLLLLFMLLPPPAFISFISILPPPPRKEFTVVVHHITSCLTAPHPPHPGFICVFEGKKGTEKVGGWTRVVRTWGGSLFLPLESEIPLSGSCLSPSVLPSHTPWSKGHSGTCELGRSKPACHLSSNQS